MILKKGLPLPEFLKERFPGAEGLVCVAVKLPPKETDQPYKVASSGLAPDYHDVVRDICAGQGEVLCDHSYYGQKEMARRAGLGAVARNGLLWCPELKCFPYLGEIVTDRPAEAVSAGSLFRCPAVPCKNSACASCPALKDGFCRELCISHITQKNGPFSYEEAVRIGYNIYGCDLCQQTCPLCRWEPLRVEMPPLEFWLDISKAGFEENRSRYPFLWIGRNKVRRNALAAAYNLRLDCAEEYLKKAAGDPSAAVSQTASALLEHL